MPSCNRAWGPDCRPAAILLALAVFPAHAPFLRLPYFWDEMGQFVPAALDLYRAGAWIPRSTVPNVHPPGLMAFLAGAWHLAGYSIEVTRLAMLAVSAASVLAAYTLARRLCRGLPGDPALVAAAWLAVSPLFFAQSLLAQLDLPAMLLASVALRLFLDERRRASAAVCTVLVMVKETGILVPLVLAIWLWRERGWRAAAVYCWPGVALAGWLMVLSAGTGNPLGNAEFARYNLEYPLHPARLFAAVVRRLHALFLADFHWVGTLAIILAWRRTRLFAAREWKVAGCVGLAHLAAVTVVGGAALERYLLPVMPVLYAAMAAATALLPRLPRIATRTALGAGLVAGVFWNPPYPFPLENNLAFTDYVKLHQVAAGFLEKNYPHASHVLTAWPLSQALARPELGYVDRGFQVREVRNFRASTISAEDWKAAEIFILYSTTWNPRWSWLRVPAVRRLWERYYSYEPDIEAPPPGWRLAARWTRRGQWVEVHVKKTFLAFRLLPIRGSLSGALQRKRRGVAQAMNLKKVALSAGVLALALVTSVRVNRAQGPLYDKVLVNMPYTVTVGDKVLQPGDYVIRQLPSTGGASRVLLIYSDQGMKFETSTMTIPALDNRTPEDTKVVLHHFGNDYYFDKIWIQGKNYGYEFPLPDAVKARQRERMEPISVAATYEAVPEEQPTAEVTPTPAPQPAPEVAEAQPQPAPEAQPAPAPVTRPAEIAPAPMAERREMPETAANWVLLMLSGGLMSGAGLAIFRRRR